MILMSEKEETPRLYLVHLRREGADRSLCSDRWDAYIVVEEDETAPYLIERVETLCGECRKRQLVV